MKNRAAAESGSLVRAIANVPRVLCNLLRDSFTMGSWVGFSSSPRESATLNHEVRDDAVEDGTVEVAFIDVAEEISTVIGDLSANSSIVMSPSVVFISTTGLFHQPLPDCPLLPCRLAAFPQRSCATFLHCTSVVFYDHDHPSCRFLLGHSRGATTAKITPRSTASAPSSI